MKKLFVLALACLMLAGCGKKLDNVPALSLIQEQGEQWAEEKLAGYSPDDLREIWGEPDGTLFGMWGEIWFLDAEHTGRITVYYDADGKVENVRMDTAPGLEPAPDPEPEPIPEPVDLTSLSAPPGLEVFCGGQSVQAVNCGCTWVTENGILCADAPHPKQMKENLTKLETAEDRAVLKFEVPPEEVYVCAWDETCTDACDGLSQYVTTEEDGTVHLLPGGYIYDVTAKWGDGETAGGTGTYAFYIDKLYPHDE